MAQFDYKYFNKNVVLKIREADLSKQGMKKINEEILEATKQDNLLESLILDDNDLSNLDELKCLVNLKQLSATKNKIRRMVSIPPLSNLCILDLSNNSIVCIEGLIKLNSLKHLNLAGNYIKNIDGLSHNLNLEYVDLSCNAITFLNDISFLKQLKELYLHQNHIISLRQGERYLPASLEVLTMNDNKIPDLAEISHLEHIDSLNHLAIKGNPCLENVPGRLKFNYRPYLKMWCLNLTHVDGVPLDPLESLKAEWLYSQGRGRRFRPGNQEELAQFLATTCPLSPKTTNEDRKLLLILSKAEQYKQQMHRQPGDLGDGRMAISYHDVVGRASANASPEVMSRSLDCAVLRNSSPATQRKSSIPTARSATPLQAASTLVPVPESLVSPDVVRPMHPSLLQQPAGKGMRFPLAGTRPSVSPCSTPRSQRKILNTSPRSSPSKILDKSKQEIRDILCKEVTPKNLQKIQMKATQKRSRKEEKLSDEDKENKEGTAVNDVQMSAEADLTTWRAAISIQRRWRGYRARNQDPLVKEACRTIQTSRMQEYIMKVAEDMETTKSAMESNRKLQVIQMKAIESVWRKLEGSDLETLATTCTNLTKQVEELRDLVQTLQGGIGRGEVAKQASPASTQTDIIAVQTPQGETVFPTKRPVELSLVEQSNSERENFSKSEPECLTPACQEGRNLQVIASPTPSLD